MLSFYTLPLHIAFIITIATVLILGTAIAPIKLKSEKAARIVCLIFLIAYALFILNLTVFSRGSRTEREIDLIPLSMLANASENSENYRSMLMNICLFMPFGAALSLCLGSRFVVKSKSAALKIIATFLTGAVFSAAIESCQYIFMLGYAQTDDVICNALGALLGCSALIPCAVFIKIRNSRQNPNAHKNKH